MTISEDQLDLYPHERVVREGDLDAHLDSDRATELRTPDQVVRYYQEPTFVFDD